MPRQPSVKADRTAALRPKLLAVMAAYPHRTEPWDPKQLMLATRCDGHELGGALRVLTRQGKLLQVEGGYRLPPAESSPP
jgi:hypothetical protein